MGGCNEWFCHSLSPCAVRTPRLWGQRQTGLPTPSLHPLNTAGLKGAIRTNGAQRSLLQAKASLAKMGQEDGWTISQHFQHPPQ